MLAIPIINGNNGDQYMSANWDKAKQAAQDVLKKFSNDGSSINAFEVAKSEGISIEYFKPEEGSRIANASGLLNAAKKTIYLNITESPERQNFTLAHELGHYFLRHNSDQYGIYWREQQYAVSLKTDAEKEADCFAAELLMPKSLIEQYKKKYHFDDIDYHALANLLGVSDEAMKNRLKAIRNGRAVKSNRSAYMNNTKRKAIRNGRAVK